MPRLAVKVAISLIFYLILPSTLQAQGTIVIINGTSSAGKTSITKELQKIYGDSYVFVNADNFYDIYTVEHPTQKPESLYMCESFNALLLHVKQLSLNGKNVFADIVQSDDQYEHDFSILKCDKLVKILVYCPLDVIVEHVEKRNTSGDKKEKRTISQAVAQFKDIYKIQESAADMIIDYIPTSRINRALQVAMQEINQYIKTEIYLDSPWKLTQKEAEQERGKWKLFANQFIEQFQLDTHEKIALAPKHSWDLVLNTKISSSAECADAIKKYLDN